MFAELHKGQKFYFTERIKVSRLIARYIQDVINLRV